MESTKHSLTIRISQTNGRNTMTNYGLEILFWVILGVVIVYQYEESKK